MEELLQLLASQRLLDRESALRKVEREIDAVDDDEGRERLVSRLRESVRCTLRRAIARDVVPVRSSPEASESKSEDDAEIDAVEMAWEEIHGALLLATMLSQKHGTLQGRCGEEVDADEAEMFRDFLLECCDALLEHPEHRIRFGVATLLGALSLSFGASVFADMKDRVQSCIQKNFERNPGDASAALRAKPDEARHEQSSDPTAAVMHDTEGWKCLETALAALQEIINGCVASHVPDAVTSITYLIDAQTFEVVDRSVSHTNRFVRERSFFTYAAICKACFNVPLFFDIFSDRLAEFLSRGLADNWSQVRYAASVAVRNFFLTAQNHGCGEEFYPILLPRMCLNRYYVAEGVKLYSHETWRQVTGMAGKELLQKYIKETVEYYCMQSEADNHAVREAACHCIAELGAKLDPNPVRPFISQLHNALMICFRDASWPVRDAACQATGRFVRAFPAESVECLEELYQLWIAHLSDNIWSVREDSAIALGDVLHAYGSEALKRVEPVLRELLPQAKDQPQDSHLNATMENATTFGVAAKKSRANDPTLHTNQQVFSCGSLAPKLKRGAGCMDHGFTRAKEPWESSDGAIYLLRELSQVFPKNAASFLSELSELADLRHFAHYHMLQETLWKQLPIILKNIHKDDASAELHLSKFAIPLINTLQGDNRLAMNAASLSYLAIKTIVGEDGMDKVFTSEQQQIANDNKFVVRNSR